MGYVRTDGEDDIQSSGTASKRFKFPKKLLEDCNGVHLTCFPRKIRSAMKKRCCRSISLNIPASKKLNCQTDGVKFHGKNGLMSSSLNLKQNKSVNFPKDDDSLLLVSKDEEEVAQALFALAGVIPKSAQTRNDEVGGEQSEDKHTDLPKTANSGPLVEEAAALKAEVVPKAPHQKHDESIASVVKGLVSNVITLPFLNDTHLPDLSMNKMFAKGSGGDGPKVDTHLTTIMSERISCSSDVSCSRTDVKFQSGSKLQAREENLASCNYKEIAWEQTGAACGLPEAQYMVMENRNTGSAFWPGLTSRISCNCDGLHSVKLPARSHNSSSPAEYVSGCGPKDGQVVLQSNKLRKRCLTHVYISCYIRDSQAAGKINRPSAYSSQKASEGSNSGASGNHLDGSRNSVLGVGSSNSSASLSPEKIAAEVRNAVLLHKRLVQDQQQASTISYGGRKQSLDHPTGYVVEASNDTSGAGYSKGTSSHLLPFLQSQSQPAIPFPLLQNYYTCTSFSTHASAAAAQQVQMPTYVGSTSYGPPQMGLSPTSAPQLELQQQLRKKAPVLMAPYKSGVSLPYEPVNWQSGVLDISPLLNQAQNPFHPSCSSVDMIGTKYAPIFLR